jgi:Zn-dependent protease with chaperone function
MRQLPDFRRDLSAALHYTFPMRLPSDAPDCLSRMIALLACAVLLGACTTSPTSGRPQFNLLPDPLETAVPDLRFEVKTLLATGGGYCREEENPCPAKEAAEHLARRIAPIAARLGNKATELSSEMAQRVPQVEVFVVPGESVSVSSSAGGKIAVGGGLARLDLSDTDLALALAREFGRLAAAHHRESTSAGLAVSLIAGSPLTSAYLATSIIADLIFPMGALAKAGISLLASLGTEQLVEASQQDEADAFAAKLLPAAGYDLRQLADVRPYAHESAIRVGWLPSYLASRAKLAAMTPHVAEAGADGLAKSAPIAEAASRQEPAPALELPSETRAVAIGEPVQTLVKAEPVVTAAPTEEAPGLRNSPLAATDTAALLEPPAAPPGGSPSMQDHPPPAKTAAKPSRKPAVMKKPRKPAMGVKRR